MPSDNVVESMLNNAENISEHRGILKGHAEGRAEGTESATRAAIENLMDTMKWTANQSMTALKIPENEQSKYTDI